MNRLIITFVLFGALLLAGCGGGPAEEADNAEDESAKTGEDSSSGSIGERVSVSGGSFVRISPDELKSMTKKKDTRLINTHIPFEGNLPETDLSIPYNKIGQGQNLDKLPEDKGTRIILYCKGGPMSYEAAGTLVDLGYTNVMDLNGGMDAWKRAGYPLEGI